jgi:hypothetical protein
MAGFCSRTARPSPQSGTSSGGTGCSCSPYTCSTARLVSRTFMCGDASSRSTISGDASITCSKLSSNSNVGAVTAYLAYARNASRRSRPAVWRSPTSRASAVATLVASVSGATDSMSTPPVNACATCSAAWSARRVLPLPPGPVRVTRRTASSRNSRVIASRSR